MCLPPSWVPALRQLSISLAPQAPQGPRLLARQGLRRRVDGEGATRALAASVPESETRWPGLTRPRFPPGGCASAPVAALRGQQLQQVGGSWEGRPEELPVGGDSGPAYLWQHGHLPFIF